MRIAIAIAVLACACGDNTKPEVISAPISICGNGLLEQDEQCDDDDTVKDGQCDAVCRFTCGNGMVDGDVGELCDSGIASGAGSCPTSCDDAEACTDDVLDGTDCIAECLHVNITGPADGDGCCPPSANANTDNDCIPMCGNGVVEQGEVCDTDIATGPGACPASCADGQVCTTDTLQGGGTCQAACVFAPITLPANNDGCCPPGANGTNDNDCVGCGNGVVEAGETCDTAIATGPGACPTTCSDTNVCTSNVLNNGGTCQAVCAFPPITQPTNNDGCCPPGANANNDNDCLPVCGNSVKEGTEQCDDGNTNNTDDCANNCTLNPVAFRFSDLDLRDPHVFVSVGFCFDVTDTVIAGFSVNKALQDAITLDTDDADNFLQISPTLVFRQFSQTAATQPLELHFANCTAPIGTTSCTPSDAQVVTATATNMQTGTCLAALAGTVRPYSPAVTATAAPCFVTNAVTVTINLGGIPITLTDAQIAGRYTGGPPATSFTNGLLRGFISEADANATIIPMDFPVVGGRPLSSLLAGGMGSCGSGSDKDTNNGVVGWWFYLNFPAAKVPWSEP